MQINPGRNTRIPGTAQYTLGVYPQRACGLTLLVQFSDWAINCRFRVQMGPFGHIWCQFGPSMGQFVSETALSVCKSTYSYVKRPQKRGWKRRHAPACPFNFQSVPTMGKPLIYTPPRIQVQYCNLYSIVYDSTSATAYYKPLGMGPIWIHFS